MKVISNKIEDRTAYFNVEIEPPEMEEQLDSAYKRVVKKADVPGFRKGNAPREVLEQYIGKDKLLEEARSDIITKACKRIIDEQKLSLAIQPVVKVVQDEPMMLEVILPLTPIIEIGDYHNIRMQPEKVKITDKDVDETLERLQKRYVTKESVDRPVKAGDTVTADIVGLVYESPVINKKCVQLKIAPEFPPEIPGLSDNFIGMKKNEEKEFKLKLPEEYPNKLLAEKEATFQIKVIDITEEKLPNIDDELAKKASPDGVTIDVLRERIARNIQVEYEQKANSDFEEKIVNAVIEKSKLEISRFMIDQQAKYLIENGLQHIRSSCKTKEEYEEKLKQLQMEEINEYYQSLAEYKMKWSLVLFEIARAEGIIVSEDEVALEIENITRGAVGEEREQNIKYFQNPQNRERVRILLSARKTIDLLKDIATKTDKQKKKAKSKRKEAK